MSFQEFGLLESVVHGVQSLGFVEPRVILKRGLHLNREFSCRLKHQAARCSSLPEQGQHR